MSENVDLNEVLAMLDLDVMAKAFGIRHYTIREQFVASKMTIDSYDAFMDVIGGYYKHHYLKRYDTDENTYFPEHYVHGMVRTLLDSLYQGEGGMEYAYKICVRGIEGGVKSVLDKIYQYFLKEDEEKYANYIIDRVVKLDWDKKVELVKQYQQKFQAYLSDGARMKDPQRLASHCKELIMHHVQIIAKIKTQIGDY